MNRAGRRAAEKEQRRYGSTYSNSRDGGISEINLPSQQGFDSTSSAGPSENAPTYTIQATQGGNQGFFDTSSRSNMPEPSQASWAGVVHAFIQKTSRTLIAWLFLTVVFNYFYLQSLAAYREKRGYLRSIEGFYRQWIALLPESLYVVLIWLIGVPLFSYFLIRRGGKIFEEKRVRGAIILVAIGVLICLLSEMIYLYFFGVPSFIESMLAWIKP